LVEYVVPANVIDGFKIRDAYPFNPMAVLDHDPCEVRTQWTLPISIEGSAE